MARSVPEARDVATPNSSGARCPLRPPVCHHAGVERFDVIIVTHDHAATLGACLEAVARQEVEPARVVVIDNASADGGPEVAAAHAGDLPLDLVRLDENTGFAAAVNRGLERTSSAWVLLLNPDCAPRPGFVRRLLEAAEAMAGWRRPGSVTGKLLRASGPELAESAVIDAAGMVVSPAGRHFDRGSGEPDDGRYGRPAWVFGGTGAATLYRREALDDVRYPDGQFLAESFFAVREDAELAWRLQHRGWPCLYVPDAVAAHRRGLRPERGRRQDVLVNRHSVTNRFLLRLHCADLYWHLAAFPWWLLRDIVVVGACLSVEPSSVPGLAAVWRLRGDAIVRRRWVLGRRLAPRRHLQRWFRKGGWVEEVAPR